MIFNSRLKFNIKLLIIALATISAAQGSDHESNAILSRDECSEFDGARRKQEPVLLHRFYHPQRVNHHYRISYSDDINKQLKEWGYTNEGVQGKVYKYPATGTVPLHRYYHADRVDHFYTAKWEELGAGKIGYVYEGIECYVYPNPKDGTVPLYRYYNGAGHDHFYTTNWEELGAGKHGWGLEGIAGYIYPKD